MNKNGLPARAMNTLDQIFVIVFARHRRNKKHSDLESAWRNASFKVSGYLGLPIAALTMLLTLAIYSLKRFGEPIDQQSALLTQGAAGLIWLVVAVLLDKRFKKYLFDLPELPKSESHAERAFIIKFRAISLGIFFLVGLVCFAWFKAGQTS